MRNTANPPSERATKQRPLTSAGARILAGFGAAAFCVIVASATAWWFAAQSAETISTRLDALTRQVATQIEYQLRRYEYGLRGARGAIVAAGGVSATAKNFEDYARTRDIETEFPGARGFGFIRRVKRDQEAAFLAEARRGRADFRIKSIGTPFEEEFVIQFIQPEGQNKEAVGLDIASERARRDAALAALASGSARLTTPITLLQLKDKPARGFLLVLPVFQPGLPITTAEERKRALIGWSYAPLAIDDVLASIDLSGGEFGYSLADEHDGRRRAFYATGARPDADPTLVKQLRLRLFGQEWALEVWGTRLFIDRLGGTNPATAALWVLAVSLLSLAVLFLVRAIQKRDRHAAVERSRLAAIVDGSNDAIVGKALDGTITDWNPAAERLFGYAAKEAIGRTAASLIVPPELAYEETEILAKVRAGASVPHFRTVRRTRDGVALEMLVNLSPIRSVDGELIGVATMARDITAQAGSERHIRELNASLERQVAERTAQLQAFSALQTAILNHASYAVIATDPNGLITLFNPAAERMLGYAAVDMVGHRTPAAFLDAVEMRERARARTLELAEPIKASDVFIARPRRGLPESDTWTYITKGGDRIPVRLDITLMRSDAGENLGVLGIAVDLTEQLARERELLSAKQTAERAANAKSEFLAAMSHELRTPLNSIIGFSGLMLESGELQGATVQRHARLVHDASRTLLSIVNDVLDVSRIEAGSLDLDPQPFSPRALVEGTAELLRPQVTEKELSLRLELPDNLPAQLLGDSERLRQILLNLMSNALKFTARGSVRVVLNVIESSSERTSLRFAVIDTGIGIPLSKRDRIFHRFSQVDSSIARRYGGSGLGLSICKSLVDMMGGEIGFESREGAGSEFWFTVGFKSVADASQIWAEPLTREVPTRSLSILMAEDVETNRELAVSLLSKWGHRVDVAANGLIAVDAAQKNSYDLILMDIQMPTMDGIEATTRIRELGGSYQWVPIIAMTANVLGGDQTRFQAAGMNDHLGKPYMPRELQRMVMRWGGVSADGPSIEPERQPEILQAPAVVDETILKDLADTIGTEKLALISRAFVTDVTKRFSDPGCREALRRDAHSVASTAGLMGLMELSQAARALEEVCQTDRDFATGLQRFMASRQRALAQIERRFEKGLAV